MTETWSVTARWIFPGTGPPLEEGRLRISGDRIEGLVDRREGTAEVDFGNCAILPGLVNAHTHLDLSGMRDLAPPGSDFTAWLRQVVGFRRNLPTGQIDDDIQDGLQECLQSGATLIGEVSGDGGSWAALVDSPIRSVVFREMLGLPKERAERTWAAAQTWLGTSLATPCCRPGLSPHAPYSARTSLIRAAAHAKVPVTIHLGESAAERDLLEDRSGPFVPFLQDLGVWDPVGLADSPEHVLRLLQGDQPTLLAHGTYLAPTAVLPANFTVVYCPRTHAAFGHARHPFREMMNRGVRVAIGTDSLASNPDLSVLNEIRFLHAEQPEVPGDLLLQMATLHGAEGLGWGDQCGSLEAGKSADFIVIPLPDSDSLDPHELWLENEAAATQVWCRGHKIWSDQ